MNELQIPTKCMILKFKDYYHSLISFASLKNKITSIIRTTFRNSSLSIKNFTKNKKKKIETTRN